MSRIQPIYSDRVRYKLSHNPTGTEKVQEPTGWRDDDNEFVRDKTFHGIFPQMTNSLTFYDTGFLFIEEIFSKYGINADLILTKEERNPRTDVWEFTYTGFLDLTTYSKEDDSISVKFYSSNLLKTIKARQGEKIEIDRLDTLKGNIVPYLEPKTVELDGRLIFLKSLLVVKPEDSSTNAFRVNFSDGNTRFGLLPIPTTIEYASDIKVNAVFPDAGFRKGSPLIAEQRRGFQAEMFYADNDRDKNIRVQIECSFDLTESKIDDLNNAEMFLVLARYANSTEYDAGFKETLTPNLISNSGVVQNRVDVSIDQMIRLTKGDSLSLQLYGQANFGGTFNDGDMSVNLSNIISSIKVTEESSFDPTVSNVHLPFEVCNRFLNIFTNQEDLLISNVFGRTDIGYSIDGEASLIGLAHGFWLRGFNKDSVVEDSEDNRYKSMSFSFKDFYESYFKIWNLGAGVETIGFKEVFRIEKLSYFYNRNVLIKLGNVVDGVFEYVQVSNVKRTIETDDFTTSIDIGYEKGAEYEEAIGLDEYNGRSTFTTILDKVENNYEAVSKFRADSYGMEFARRMPYELDPTQDTIYDLSTWFVDMKKNELDTSESISKPLKQRLWQDDFSEAPIGVFSPDSAQNLRLSPVNILLRHGWAIGSGLTKYLESFIKYSSSDRNSGMSTTLRQDLYPEYGGTPRSESGNIEAKDLERARVDGTIIDFEYEVDYDLLQQVRGKTVILGKEVQNFYGLVSFKNEYGEIEEGYLTKLSPTGTGKWTLKKFNN